MAGYEYSWMAEKGRAFAALNPGEKRIVLGVAVLLVVGLSAVSLSSIRWIMRPEKDYAVSGMVTRGGEKLVAGDVTFRPHGGASAGQRTAQIVDGRFTLEQQAGLRRGATYQVSIRGFEKTGRRYENADPERSADEVVQVVPEQYNTKTTLLFEASRTNLRKPIVFDVR